MVLKSRMALYCIREWYGTVKENGMLLGRRMCHGTEKENGMVL